MVTATRVEMYLPTMVRPIMAKNAAIPTSQLASTPAGNHAGAEVDGMPDELQLHRSQPAEAATPGRSNGLRFSVRSVRHASLRS